MREQIIVDWILRITNIITLGFAIYGFGVFVDKFLLRKKKEKTTKGTFGTTITYLTKPKKEKE